MKRYTAIAAALAVFLAACGGSTTETDNAASSPLAEFLGDDVSLAFGDGDQEAAQAAFAEQERERQQVIAECMQREGFEYIPMDTSDFLIFEEADGLEYGSTEWAAKYGFGITTQRFSQEEVGPDLVGYDDSGFRDQMENDPNSAIVEAMSESEREAYYEALYGGEDSFPTFDDSLSDEEIEAQLEDFDFQPSGCEGEAYSEDDSNRFYQDFSDELEEMWERMEADPRIAEAEQKVADCVGEKGFDYTNMEDLYERWEPEMSAIEEDIGYPGGDLTEEDFAQMSEEELDAIFNQPRTIPDDVKARLGELQQEEIAMAVAVDECGGGFENQADLFNEVRVEYEQQFVDDNADRLADYKSS